MSGIFLLTTSFLATGVEMVEALTIILATGITRGWRSTMLGAGAAAIILAAAVLAFGASVTSAIPLPVLRVVVGTFLLIFGLQWLRKSILRYAGVVALHDEEKIFRREVEALRGAEATSGALDWTAFVIAFKGVLLEGLEAVFIVITFGMAAQQASLGGFSGIGLASVGAVAALVLVVLAGLLLHRPLSTVPENAMKFAVGLLLISFGTFWAGEGVGIEWPLADITILLLLAFYGAISWAMVVWMRGLWRSHRSAAGVSGR